MLSEFLSGRSNEHITAPGFAPLGTGRGLLSLYIRAESNKRYLDMQLALALTVLTVASVFAECDMGGLGEAQHPVALRLCKLEVIFFLNPCFAIHLLPTFVISLKSPSHFVYDYVKDNAGAT